MSREAWNFIKQSKRFYVKTYRWTGTVLLLSVMANVLLGGLIYYVYFHQPENAFYASDGRTPPMQLTPLAQPNASSTPLLASEVSTNQEVRVMPK